MGRIQKSKGKNIIQNLKVEVKGRYPLNYFSPVDKGSGDDNAVLQNDTPRNIVLPQKITPGIRLLLLQE